LPPPPPATPRLDFFWCFFFFFYRCGVVLELCGLRQCFSLKLFFNLVLRVSPSRPCFFLDFFSRFHPILIGPLPVFQRTSPSPRKLQSFPPNTVRHLTPCLSDRACRSNFTHVIFPRRSPSLSPPHAPPPPTCFW